MAAAFSGSGSNARRERVGLYVCGLSNLNPLLNLVLGEKRIERRHTPIVLPVIQVFSVTVRLRLHPSLTVAGKVERELKVTA